VNGSDRPALSVVLVTPARFAALRTALAHLRAQSVRERIELVIVAPSTEGLELDSSELEGFHGHRLVEAGAITMTGAPIAAGVRAARAAVVAYVEEHSYPQPGWAEALIRAHEGSWAAVGATIVNANPERMTSWASMFTDFGPCVAPVAGGEQGTLAWHHISYKRDLLLAYGSRLEAMLDLEGNLLRDLAARGHRLLLEPAAVSAHVNVSRLGSYLRSEFHGGRAFAATRATAAGWSPARRMLQAAGGPLVPMVRLRRVLREVRRSGRFRQLVPGILPPLLLGLGGFALGEMAGYVLGTGSARQRRVGIELERHLHTGG
jgi:hypothetical protein